LLDAQGATLLRMDAMQYLARSDLLTFDIVFLDPPFADNALGELCRLLKQSGCLAQHARIYIEQDRAVDAAELPDGWTLTHDKSAGNVRYSLVTAG
jgi:16S rRNA (guanine966-N2)-methyltransferase